MTFTLRIPAAMKDDFDAYKDKFNVSSVCQSAIDSEISYHKAIDEVKDKRAAAIVRLRKERDDMGNTAYQDGRKDGAVESPDYSYSELELIASLMEQNQPAMDVLSEVSGQIGTTMEEDMIDYCNRQGYTKAQRENYVQGWLEAAAEFFQEI